MKLITRGLWQAWAAGLPGALVAIWLVGLISPRSAYSHADALHWARCSVCGKVCRVLDPETRCIGCQLKAPRPAKDATEPPRPASQRWGDRFRRTSG